MRNERPVIVLVFAILNIVFGALGIICSFCSGVMIGVGLGLMNAGGSSVPFTPLPSTLLTNAIIEYAIGFILAALLTLSGIGLLGMNPWARRLSMATSVLVIVYGLAWSVITIAYTNPKMQEWQAEFQERVRQEQQKQGVSQTANVQVWQSPAMNVAITVLTFLFIIGYAVALLVVMYLPHVSAAFAGKKIGRRI